MPHTLDDLIEVMEDRSSRGAPAADPLPSVRRRIRRGGRRRAAAGAAGAALLAGTFLGVTQQLGETSVVANRAAAPPLTGTADEAFPRSAPKYGMRPVAKEHYSVAGRRAHVEFTPTGRHSMVNHRCSKEFTVYMVRDGVLSGGGCGKNDSAESYLQTEPGVPVAFEVVALPPEVTPQGPRRPWTAAELDRFLAAHTPVPADWSVQIYSGECTISVCFGPDENGVVGKPD